MIAIDNKNKIGDKVYFSLQMPGVVLSKGAYETKIRGYLLYFRNPY